MALVRDGVAEIGFVGTVPSARGHGYGAVVTAAAAAYGFQRGATMAALQASAMGERVYRRLGFVEIGRWRRYEAPASGDAG
jgi:predicted GNAT family acetyltransferase